MILPVGTATSSGLPVRLTVQRPDGSRKLRRWTGHRETTRVGNSKSRIATNCLLSKSATPLHKNSLNTCETFLKNIVPLKSSKIFLTSCENSVNPLRAAYAFILCSLSKFLMDLRIEPSDRSPLRRTCVGYRGSKPPNKLLHPRRKHV